MADTARHAPAAVRTSVRTLDADRRPATSRGPGDHARVSSHPEAGEAAHASGRAVAAPHEGAALAQAIRDRLQERLGERRYERWLRHAGVTIHERHLEIVAEDAFTARWIDRNLSCELRDAATWAVGPDARVDIRPAAPPSASPRASDCRDAPGTATAGDQISGPAAGADAAAGTSPASARGSTCSRGASPSPRPHRADVRGAARPAGGPADAIERAGRLRSLDDFVVGDSNRFAHAAATGLLDVMPGIKCGPVFIHGECGVGKTHLLQGVCRAAMERSGYRMRVVYVTAEQFTNEYIAAVRQNTLDRFRLRYRSVDLLAIDDVHFLASKVRTQSEFLHTLDAIDLTGSRVLLASDAHPSLIRSFHRGLVSRCVSGTVAAIDRPDRLTRSALVTRLVRTRGITLTDDAHDALVMQCVGSVREIEGILNKLSAMHTLMAGNAPSTAIERPFVDRIFRSPDSRPSRPIRPADLIETIAQRLQVTRQDILGNSRHRRVVLARSIAAWLIRDMTTMSFPEIARALGREAHSTVHTAIRRIDRQLAEGDHVDPGTGKGTMCLNELIRQIRHDALRSVTG